MPSPNRARSALVALRLAVGTTAFVRPDLAARLFGIDADEGAAMPSAVRLFGTREAAMGCAILMARGPELRRWLVVGAAVDALDVVTVALGTRAGRLGRLTTAVGSGMASLAVGLGLRGLVGLNSPSGGVRARA